jgi:hypothetical protein
LTTSITLPRILYTIGKGISPKTAGHSAEDSGDKTSAVLVIILVAACFVLTACRSLGGFASHKTADNGTQQASANARRRVREVLINHVTSAGDGARGTVA